MDAFTDILPKFDTGTHVVDPYVIAESSVLFAAVSLYKILSSKLYFA